MLASSSSKLRKDAESRGSPELEALREGLAERARRRRRRRGRALQRLHEDLGSILKPKSRPERPLITAEFLNVLVWSLCIFPHNARISFRANISRACVIYLRRY